MRNAEKAPDLPIRPGSPSSTVPWGYMYQGIHSHTDFFIGDLQLTLNKKALIRQIPLKLCGCLSTTKIALEPRPHVQDNSELHITSIFALVFYCSGSGGANLSSFSIFWLSNLGQIEI